MIFPSENAELNEKYEQLLKKANNIWDEFTTGNKANKKKLEKKDTKSSKLTVITKKETIRVNKDKEKEKLIHQIC